MSALKSKKGEREHLAEPLLAKTPPCCPWPQPARGSTHRDEALLMQADDVPNTDVAPFLPAEAAGEFGEKFLSLQSIGNGVCGCFRPLDQPVSVPASCMNGVSRL